MENFRDKVAVITGGASGIGRAFADRAVAEGADGGAADPECGVGGRDAHPHT